MYDLRPRTRRRTRSLAQVRESLPRMSAPARARRASALSSQTDIQGRTAPQQAHGQTLPARWQDEHRLPPLGSSGGARGRRCLHAGMRLCDSYRCG